jgi:hypothetical protein
VLVLCSVVVFSCQLHQAALHRGSLVVSVLVSLGKVFCAGAGAGACCVSSTLSALLLLQMKALVEMEGSGLVPLLTDSSYEDLGRMYSLFKRVDGGLALLRSVLGSHIKDQGRVLVNDPEKVMMIQPI